MNGTDLVRIPRFLEGEALPAGYYESPNPYALPPKAQYHFRAMVNYVLRHGKSITELTKEEVKPFLIHSGS